MGHTFLELLALQGLLFAAIVAFAAGIWIVGMERKGPRDRAVSLFVSAGALWVFAYVLWQTSEEPSQAQFWLKTLYLLGSFIPASFVLFSATVLWERLPRLRWMLALFAPNAVAYWAVFHAGAVVGASAVLLTPAARIGTLFLAAHFAVFSGPADHLQPPCLR